MFTWFTVILYIVAALGMATFAEDGDEWFEESSHATEAAAAAPSAPVPEPESEEQPADPDPADAPPSGGSESQPGGQEPAGGDESPSGDQPSATPPAEGGEAEFWQDTHEWEEWQGEADDPSACRVLFITPSGHILLSYHAAAGTAVADPQLAPALKDHIFSHWYQVGSNPNSSFEFGALLEEDLTLAAFFKQAAKPEPACEEPSEPEEEAETGLEDGDFGDEEGLPPIQVEITSNTGDTVSLGDKVTLTAYVTSCPEGETFSVWRYNAGNGWVVAATNTQTHSFMVDENNCLLKWEFRITVIVGAAD